MQVRQEKLKRAKLLKNIVEALQDGPGVIVPHRLDIVDRR
jgi:hypothetical protein